MNKTEMKTAMRTAIEGAALRVTTALGSIDSLTDQYLRAVGVFEVQAGIAIDEIRGTFAEAKTAGISLVKVPGVKTDDWREYAATLVPGKDRKTIYRWQNAGAVARVLGDDVGNALIGSLVPLYRILSGAKTDEDRAVAETLVRETWKLALADAGTDDEGVQIAPAFETVKTLAETASPSGRSGGKGKESAKGEGTTDEGTTPAPETPETTPEGETPEGSTDESRRESASNVVQVDPVAVEAAAGVFAAQYRAWQRDLIGKPLTDEGLRSIALAVLRLAGEHSVSVMQAAVVLPAKTETPETPAKVAA